MDAFAPFRHGTAASAVRRSRKRGRFRRADAGRVRMGLEELNEADAGEKIWSFLRQHGRALLGLLVLFLVVHDIFGTHGFLAMRRTQLEIENLQLQQEIKELKTDPHKIEKIARDELGLAKPGEVIIKIPQSQQLRPDSAGKP